MTPAVSVVIPVHSGGKLLKPAIESVLNQTFRDFEIVLVDNNAPEETAGIARDYGSKYPDRIQVFKETQMGVSAARNLGIRMARGEYIALLDDDDEMLPERLEKQYAAARNKPEISLFFCGQHNVDRNDGRVLQKDIFGAQGGWKESEAPIRKLVASILPDRDMGSFQFSFPSTMFFMRDKAVSAGLFDTNLLRDQDSNFCLRMFFEGDFWMVREVLTLFKMRTGEDNLFRNADFISMYVPDRCRYYLSTSDFLKEKDPFVASLLEKMASYELNGLARHLIRFVEGIEDQNLIRTMFFLAWKKSPLEHRYFKSFLKSLFPVRFYPRLFWFEKFLPGRIDPSISGKYMKEVFDSSQGVRVELRQVRPEKTIY